MSLQRPLQYISVYVDAEACERSERWGPCYGCYRRVRVRDLELLTRTRRHRYWSWVKRAFCGECCGLVLQSDLGMPIPNEGTG